MPTQVSTSSATSDILIAGGGPVGLTLATALAQRGFSTTLVDAGGPSGADSRAWFIAYGCWRIFCALGLADRLETVSQPVSAVGADADGGGIAFLAGETDGEIELGRMVEASALGPVLIAAADSAGVRRLTSARADTPVFGDPHVSMQVNGEVVRASLVIGCDGPRSGLRDAAGIRFEGRGYSTRAISTTLRLSSSHGGEARQIFLRGGPIAALPLVGDGQTGDRVNLVWTAPAPVAEALLAMTDAGFEAELAHQAPGFVPGARLAGPRASFPMAVRIADRFHGPRLALAGDSAHLVHPLAGQGLNLGLKDAAALVDVIADAAHAGLDIGSEAALAGYTRWRRADVTALAAAMEAFAVAFSAPAPVRAAAGMAMKAAGGSRMARRLFSREAGADLGDLPTLMRAS